MSDNGHILIVDDAQEIRDIVREYLTGEGFRVSTAHDGAGMRGVLSRSPADLVILDLMLPGEDGLTLARSLRSQSGIGIIILTGRGETVDRIIGLEMGADDYLPKPFNLRELLARVKSVLRRVQSRTGEGPQPTRSHARFAGWSFNLSSRELLSPSGQGVRLTTGEFDLLAAFVNHANQVLSRDRLLDLARNRGAGPFDRTIDVQVGRLRRKLDDDPQNPSLIKTVRGSGYIFTPAVELS
jgi:two-component system OmpR family response regulator